MTAAIALVVAVTIPLCLFALLGLATAGLIVGLRTNRIENVWLFGARLTRHDAIDDLLEQIRDAELSLCVYDEGRTAEYWERHPQADHGVVAPVPDKRAPGDNKGGE